MRRYLSLLLLLLAGCLPTGPGIAGDESPPIPVQSHILPLEALTRSSKVLPLSHQPGELIWVTGASLQGRPEQAFVGDCTLDYRWPEWHNRKLKTTQSPRLFGLGQGLYRYQLPQGFGIPIYSNEPLLWTYRVFNLDAYLKPTQVQVRSEFDFIRDRGLQRPYIPLLVSNSGVTVAGSQSWPVPVGGNTVSSPIDDMLQLEFDRRLHGLTVALHTHARGFELYDATADRVVLTLKVLKRRADGSLEEVETFTSADGLLLEAGHHYQARVSYDNPTRSMIRGVAYVTAYFYDGQFSKYN
ncbi:MAG: hypothetical protein KC910_34425 [Candidatus Eremiobacteraeota bacterium]|nr:hypothetical protein [Candidatus Eremiobacteraeota bacterium]